MNKLNVSDYVRTKDGIIAKITDIIEDLSVDCDRDVFDLDNMAMMEIPWNFKNEYIIKSSQNIIDLIEIGDYVNGELVIRIYEKNEHYEDNKNNMKFYEKTIETQNDYYETIPSPYLYNNKEIKTVVTKESFENISYKVGE